MLIHLHTQMCIYVTQVQTLMYVLTIYPLGSIIAYNMLSLDLALQIQCGYY